MFMFAFGVRSSIWVQCSRFAAQVRHRPSRAGQSIQRGTNPNA